MRKLLLAAASSLALAGCTTTTGSIDTAVQQNLPAICKAATSAHLAFTIVAASGNLSERTVRQERIAYDVLAPLCVDPSNATSASILVAAAGAYSTITIALREAEKEG
jgi:hypothetical protein